MVRTAFGGQDHDPLGWNRVRHCEEPCGFTLAEENEGPPPGQQMQQRGSDHGPATSGYAPGHDTKEHGSKKKKKAHREMRRAKVPPDEVNSRNANTF